MIFWNGEVFDVVSFGEVWLVWWEDVWWNVCGGCFVCG